MNEHSSRKDNTDDPSPPLNIKEEHKLYRPKSTWEPAPGNCEALYVIHWCYWVQHWKTSCQLTSRPWQSDERSALQSLKNWDDIYNHLKRIYSGCPGHLSVPSWIQLTDERFYKKLDHDPNKGTKYIRMMKLLSMFTKQSVQSTVDLALGLKSNLRLMSEPAYCLVIKYFANITFY